ncbi:uncharacterized protein LOC132062675 [Lycium ferocissimum]|uniref:uncharacterized protein LOC132062675 n=1 Tax=Lycium ferocissimum TaxID=112874 RepID=UPI0028153156|nr:uncharacterized protein LOC132062675 [Lycium ferocissimum]
MVRLSRGVVVMAMVIIVAAIQVCSHQAAAGVSWGEPCSDEAKTKIEGCMKEETVDNIDKCCSILHSVIDDSCPCWVHAKLTDRALAILYFIYCDIAHPLCSSAQPI